MGGDLDRLGGGHGGVFGVGGCGAHPDDAVAWVEGCGGGDDGAGGFFAEDFGLGGGVEARAEVAGWFGWRRQWFFGPRGEGRGGRFYVSM